MKDDEKLKVLVLALILLWSHAPHLSAGGGRPTPLEIGSVVYFYFHVLIVMF